MTGTAVAGFFGYGYVKFERLATTEHAAALKAEAANADLQRDLAQVRDQAGVTAQQLHGTQARLTALNEEARSKQQQLVVSEQASVSKADRIAQLNKALEQAQRDLHMSEAQRVTLAARVSKAETDLADQHGKQSETQTSLDQSQKKLQQIIADRDKAASDREHLKQRVNDLEHRLAAMQGQPKPVAEARPEAPASGRIAAAQAAPVTTATATPVHVAASVPAPAREPVPQPTPAPQPTIIAALPVAAPAAAAPAQSTVAAETKAEPVVAAVAAPAPAPVQTAAVQAPPVVAAAPAAAPASVVAAAALAAVARPADTVANARPSHGSLAEFERVLGSSGVDVSRLFAQYGMRTGDGGPFIPASMHAPAPSSLTPDKLAALRAIMKSVPVAAPLDSYEIGSRFGVRGDPMNGHSAYHTGLDFRAPYMSPIYATAAGTVTFSGYRDDYGKVVEIDHGNGLTTRYAHMHRQTVSVGQRVAAHEQIGFLGSTGRATGPHVHYEVLVNGEPQDPERFMALAKAIPVSAQR